LIAFLLFQSIDGKLIIDVGGIDPDTLVGQLATLFITLNGSINGTFSSSRLLVRCVLVS
jgi:hypothetical protein